MKRFSTFFILILVLLISCDNNWRSKVIEEVTEAELRRIEPKGEILLADNYSGFDHKGRKVNKENYGAILLSAGEKEAEMNVNSLEIQPLRPQYALSTGIHLMKTMHFGEFPRVDSLRFSSVWKKNKGTWRLISNHYTSIQPYEKKMQVSNKINNQDLKKYCGSFVLSTKNPMEINIQHNNQNLELSIPKHMEEARSLILVSKDEFQLEDDNWELEFISEDSIMLNAWGNVVGGRRL